jgi:hypothetical protein
MQIASQIFNNKNLNCSRIPLTGLEMFLKTQRLKISWHSPFKTKKCGLLMSMGCPLQINYIGESSEGIILVANRKRFGVSGPI